MYINIFPALLAQELFPLITFSLLRCNPNTAAPQICEFFRWRIQHYRAVIDISLCSSLAIIPIPIFVVDRWRNCSAASESAKPLQWLPKTTGWRTALALSRCAAQKDPFLQLRLLFLD